MTTEAVRTRFAPSPTGDLHIGGVRSALFNWLFARHHGGTFVLRVEDTDAARNTEESQQGILTGMRGLGLDWDEGPEVGGDHGPYFQSQRKDIYDAYFEKLVAADRVYEDGGAMRFRFDRTPTTVDDQICGSVTFNQEEPDMTVRRPDGSYIFHFVNVVDDIEMKISHVIRGEDHLANTWKHIQLFEAFAETPPTYAHVPLILNEDGSKMSKRSEGGAVSHYAKLGFLPAAVTNYLALLGWSPKDDSEIFEMEELVKRFDLKGVNKSNAKFSLEKCSWFNQQRIAAMSPEAFAAKGATYISEDVDAAYRDQVLPLFQERIHVFSELKTQADFFFNDAFDYEESSVKKALKDPDQALAVVKALGEKLDNFTPWTHEALFGAVKEVVKEQGVKMGAVMLPGRVAFAGTTNGPGFGEMLEVLGPDRVKARVQRFVETYGS